jgi:hypothetical protein
MAIARPSQSEESSPGRELLYTIRCRLGSRRGFIFLAAAALVGGLALNWSWLVAAGIAPLLLAVLPCVVMCALGLCMNRMAGRGFSSDETARKDASGGDDAWQNKTPDGPLPLMRRAGERRDIQING